MTTSNKFRLGAWIGWAVCLLVLIVWLSLPGPKKPWWFLNDNQLGWEMKNQVVPEGFDDVSTQIVQRTGLSHFRWDHDKMQLYTPTNTMRLEWVAGKVLIRYTDGKEGIFNGGAQLHPPLRIDPFEVEKQTGTKPPLRTCLAAEDDGKLHDYKPGKSLTDMFRESGVEVTR